MLRSQTNERSMVRNRIRRALIGAAGILALTAVAGLLALPDITLAGKGGNGGGGNTEPMPPDPIFDDTLINFCVNFDNFAGVPDPDNPGGFLVPPDRILSDGLLALNGIDQYCHEEDDFRASSMTGNIRQASMATTGRNKKNQKDPRDREMVVDFSGLVEEGILLAEEVPVFPAAEPGFNEVAMRFRIRSRLTGEGLTLGEMLIGEAADTENFRVLLGEDVEGNGWNLWYDPESGPAAGCGGVDGTVTRVDEFTWVITAKTACLIKFLQGTGNVRFGAVDMPFTMMWVDERWVRWLESQP